MTPDDAKQIPFDWKEAERIADLPAYRCLDHLRAMKEDLGADETL